MRKPRWIVKPVAVGGDVSGLGGEVVGAGQLGRAGKPVIYHCISRVVDRRFAFGPDEKEKLRTFMRMYENFSGNRVLSYCFMCNHIHLLVEITPAQSGGLADEELLRRVGCIRSEAQVAMLAKELAEARKTVAAGVVKDAASYVAAIHERFTWRMHDLSQFMQGFLQRFSLWFNSKHERSGHLWEDRFKSVIVEDGVAARTMAAYIDLNPVRAGMVADPADYRWSSYGEAIGGGAKGNGKKSREGLVRACLAHEGVGFEAERWKDASRIYRRLMGMALGKNKGRAAVEGRGVVTKNTAEMLESEDNETVLPDLGMAGMLLCRIRYFTDGAVIGSRAFVNGAFEGARERFGAKRKDGARRMRGSGSAAKGVLWSLRDLRKRV
jgi:REP element-mobilizing transposase RayT